MLLLLLACSQTPDRIEGTWTQTDVVGASGTSEPVTPRSLVIEDDQLIYGDRQPVFFTVEEDGARVGLDIQRGRRVERWWLSVEGDVLTVEDGDRTYHFRRG